ncbi:3-hydroxyacyl-CoA dehydrogenase NAD-binding domain-containing protein [Kineococcus gypseus]|uniref:3-hydroxyacyl-CoA dehydrogenase NAD-binding domain-containing protein n=1 Tax=Kineococcus gypseus TaxID=1637102 RepID=UPI003D7CAA00
MPVHVRVVDLPGAPGQPAGPARLALLTLDPGEPRRPFVLGAAALAQLREALEEAAHLAAAGEVAAVGVTGAQGTFCAGADLKAVAGADRAAGLATGRLGHEVLGRLATLGVPSFAYVGGTALGGGLETALHATYRTVATTARGLGLPETRLGLVPGWGGTWLLPHLAGPDVAVRVAVQDPLAGDRTLTGPAAVQLGIADVALEPADFLVQSLRWTAAVLAGRVRVPRRAPLPGAEEAAAWEAAVARGRAAADARVRGAAPAPYRALDLIAAARTSTREAHFAAEDEAIADLVASPQLRASLYAFDLVQRYRKEPAGAPPRELARPVTRAGVVGAGRMASQIALLLLHRLQVPVVLTDVDEARVAQGLAAVRSGVDDLLARGRLTPGTADRLRASASGSVEKAALADCDLVVEAVFEEMAVKHAVLREVEPLLREDAVVATNTSSLSVTAMASVLEHPERFVGLHFFNPVAVLPLVEVVRTPSTDEATLATAFAVGAQLGKTCVPVRDAPAFVVNRISTRVFDEVLRAVDAGTPLLEAEHALDELGLPMTPFRLASFVGPAVMLHVHEALAAAFPGRYRVSDNLRRWVEAGSPPLVTERGPVEATGAAERVLVQGREPVGGPELLRRVQDALADEVRRVLDEGVVAGPEDVDVCLVLGTGHPLSTGGATPYLDRVGASERVTGRRFHPG